MHKFKLLKAEYHRLNDLYKTNKEDKEIERDFRIVKNLFQGAKTAKRDLGIEKVKLKSSKTFEERMLNEQVVQESKRTLLELLNLKAVEKIIARQQKIKLEQRKRKREEQEHLHQQEIAERKKKKAKQKYLLDHCRVFLANLNKKLISKPKIEAFFKDCGKISDLVLNKHNGDGHITFETKEAADKALSKSGKLLCDWHIILHSLSVPKRKKKCYVFIGNMQGDAINEHKVRNFFRVCGRIVDLRLIEDLEKRSRKRKVYTGFGHIEFNNEESAELAVKKNKKEFCGKRIHVSHLDVPPPSLEKKIKNDKKWLTYEQWNRLRSKGDPRSLIPEKIYHDYVEEVNSRRRCRKPQKANEEEDHPLLVLDAPSIGADSDVEMKE